MIANMMHEWKLDSDLLHQILHDDVFKEEFLDMYNKNVARLKFTVSNSTLSYIDGVPDENKEKLTDKKYVGTLTKKRGILKSYF